MKKLIVGGLVAAAIALGMAPAAQAAEGWCQPGDGRETIGWGFLGLTQKRTICDSRRRADGSWTRTRVIWIPAGYVSASSYCGTYSCSYTPGYYRQESVQGFEQYVVFDDNVVGGEPGWLPVGTLVIR